MILRTYIHNQGLYNSIILYVWSIVYNVLTIAGHSQHYSNPDQGKMFTVYYTVEPSGGAPEFQFVTEEMPSSIVSYVHDQQSS